MIRAPPRAGRRHKLASVLNERSISTTGPSSPPRYAADRQTHKKLGIDQSLAAAFMSKLEDCNISPAIDNAHTYKLLCDRQPRTPGGRISSPDPNTIPAVQFMGEDVIATIPSFPTGSAGAPMGFATKIYGTSHLIRK